MISNLNNNIAVTFKQRLYLQCIIILIEAYKLAKTDHAFENENDLKEDDYTATLVIKYMNQVPEKYKGHWFVAPQVPYYAINPQGIVHAKKTPRPDIRFEKYVFSNPIPINYTIEAKIIKENSTALKRRYISKGIDNFISRRYPFGCLAGYVIDSNTINCINGLNKLLKKDNRVSEVLSITEAINGHNEVYQSFHETDFIIKHIFLEF